jgi:CNT family concentrative nucleoside transporter
MWYQRLISVGGLAVMLGIAWAISENRRKFPRRIFLWGIGLQVVLAFIVLRTEAGRVLFDGVRFMVDDVIESSDAGAKLLFGSLIKDQTIGAVMAFHVLPIIIFISAISAILMAWVMHKTMKISGAEALASALLVFLGIEATTAIREYILKMTRSEIFVIMTAFMATIAGSVMVIYMTFGADPGHLLTASLMSAPAAIVIAKIMIPETDKPVTAGSVEFRPPKTTVNLVDAAATGASQGLKLALNIGAMLIAFVGLVYLVNLALGVVGLKLEEMMGWVFYPFALAMGISPDDAQTASQLLGVKTVLNEFLAYLQFQDATFADPRSRTIVIYALCGFANPGSIAILIGGLGGIDPDRRGTYAKLGVRALVAGTLAAFTTACIAGVLA